MQLNISGYGDDLTVNGVRIGDLTPREHEEIEKARGGQNYMPLENVVVSHVQDSSTLICRKPSINGIDAYVEEEIIDDSPNYTFGAHHIHGYGVHLIGHHYSQ